ncbi:MAG: AsmA family protein [Rhodobacteraceae bacterium]|nr:AsmA family protein [Paracoccaceae bacterium]
MRWIIRVIGAIAILSIIVFIGFALLPAEKIAGFAARELSQRTGRDVRFTGRIRLVFYPVLGIRTDGVLIGNAPWSKSGPMLEAESLLIGVKLQPLFSGDVKIREFRAINPVVRLEKNRDGVGNWELTPANPEAARPEGAASGSRLKDLSLADGRISNGRIIYVDHQSGRDFRLEKADLAVVLSGLAGPATLSGQAEYGSEIVSLNARIAEFGMFLSGGLTGLDLIAETDFGSLGFKGRAGISPLMADGDLVVRTSDLAKAAGMAGISAGFAKTLDASGRFTLAENGNAYLRGMTLVVDGNALNGDLDLTVGKNPKLSAKLTAGALDLKTVLGTKTAGATGDAGATAETGWSKERIDLGGLHALDADVAFSADSVDLGGIRLDRTKLRAKLDKGRLVLGLQEVNAYGGNIGGEYVINARGGLSMGGDINLRAIRLQPLLIDMAGYDRLKAKADFSVKFLTSGNSMDEMMHRLSGSGRLDIGAGELLGLDLAGMLRNLDASYRGEGAKTIFSAISGSYMINDGVLINDDLKFASNLVDATGKGKVNIAARTVEYRLTPVTFSGRNLNEMGGVTVPLLIKGPWARLNYRPDLQGLLDAELAKKKQEAEENLKADLERLRQNAGEKVQQEIDKAVEDGRERLLDELRKRLQGQ